MRSPVPLLALFVLTACPRSAPQSAAPSSSAPGRNGNVFTDSALFRLRCVEADSLRVLSPIPRQCTPRNQEHERWRVPTPVPPTPPQR